MSDIARMAGVAESTVSRALSGSPLVARRTSERILEIARATGFVANEQARGLALGRLQIIEVIFAIERGTLQQVSDPFFVDMLARLIDEFAKHDYSVLVSHATPWDPDNPRCAYISGRAAGLVIIGQGRHQNDIREFANNHSAVVVWGAVDDSGGPCIIGSDNRLGGRQATEHLLARGCRTIAFLGDVRFPEIRQRFEGYRDTLANAGVALDDRLVLPAPFDIERASEACQSLVKLYPEIDGAFAASDMIALTAISALQQHGVGVPEDIAVVGFDDIPAGAYVYPGLTTVRQNIPRAARVIAELLLALIAGKPVESARLETELVVRESSGSKAGG